MNAVTYAISYVKEEIPANTLFKGLRERHSRFNKILSVDEKLRSQVIIPTVIRDLNLNSSLTLDISLKKCNVKVIDPETCTLVIEIGDDIMGDREIITPEMIFKKVSQYLEGGSGSAAFEKLAGAMERHTESPLVTTKLEVVGRNVVAVMLPNYESLLVNDCILRCTITKDANLKHLHPSTHIKFGQLVVLATKRHIHNKLIESLDSGYIQDGHEIASIKNIVEQYQDSSLLYNEFLTTKWQRTEFANDKEKMHSMLASMCGYS